MSLQDMVTEATGTLEREEETPGSAPEMLLAAHDASELLADGRRAEREFVRASQRRIRQAGTSLAARFSAIDRSDCVGCGPEIFANLLQFLEDTDHRSELIESIRRACNRLELAMFTDTTSGIMSFLEYMWGENFENTVTRFTQADRKTVRKWVDGNEPANYHRERLLGAVVILHQLHKECGMSREDATRYFEEVRFGHSEDRRLKEKTPWEWMTEEAHWCGKKIAFDQNLRNHMSSLGADAEVFDRKFRYRFLV